MEETSSETHFLYAVRLQATLGWMPAYIAAEFGKAAEAIEKKHPDALEYRIVSHVRYAISDYGPAFENRQKYEHLLDLGWYYDTSAERWFAPDDVMDRPDVPAVPASISITSPPLEDDGWWHLNFTFRPVATENIAREEPHQTGDTVVCDVHCDETFDPIDDLSLFVERVKAGQHVRVMINEGCGIFVCMLVWMAEGSLLHLKMRTFFDEAGYHHDFLVEKDLFVNELEKALHSFAEQGGWTEWRNSLFEKDEE